MSEPEYQFTAKERPLLPGGPYLPAHAPWRRATYLVFAVIIAICATLGQASR